MKRLAIAAGLLMFASAASAQMGQGGPGEVKGGRGHKGANDYRKEDTAPKFDEKAYKAALEKIPDSKEKLDPWGGVRDSKAKSPNQANR